MYRLAEVIVLFAERLRPDSSTALLNTAPASEQGAISLGSGSGARSRNVNYHRQIFQSLHRLRRFATLGLSTILVSPTEPGLIDIFCSFECTMLRTTIIR